MKNSPDKLKGRQLAILEAMSRGEKRDAIAANLGIKRGTLNTYCQRLYLRLGAHTPGEAITKFLRARTPELSFR